MEEFDLIKTWWRLAVWAVRPEDACAHKTTERDEHGDIVCHSCGKVLVEFAREDQ